jgi:carboxymethylenebutenolidase
MSDIALRAADGGSFSGYLAVPRNARAPGILLIQEVFGVNAGMRAIADYVAARGYLVLAPDLFWRQEPGVQLSDLTEAEWAKAIALYKGFDEAKGIDDLIASLAALRALPQCSGKIGTLGFCLGGRLAYLLATRNAVDAAVGYYGVGIENALGAAAQIHNPLLLHIAEADEFVPKPAQTRIKEGLKGHPQVTLHLYPAQHGFARPGGQHYDQAAAVLAEERTANFFRHHLSA